MTTLTRPLAVAAVACAVLATGCVKDNSTTNSSGAGQPPVTATVTSSTPPKDGYLRIRTAPPSTDAHAKDWNDAQQAVSTFWKAIDDMRTAGGSPESVEGLKAIMQDKALAEWTKTAADYKAAGAKMTGASKVAQAETAGLNVGMADSKASVFYCVDVTEVKIDAPEGAQVSKPAQKFVVGAANLLRTPEGTWKVVESQYQDAAECLHKT